jgi:hypothetical protein
MNDDYEINLYFSYCIVRFYITFYYIYNNFNFKDSINKYKYNFQRNFFDLKYFIYLFIIHLFYFSILLIPLLLFYYIIIIFKYYSIFFNFIYIIFIFNMIFYNNYQNLIDEYIFNYYDFDYQTYRNNELVYY